MDENDKIKVKVLIKMILIHSNPNCLTSKQIADIINSYDWGFRTSITNKMISKLLNYELNKSENHFLKCISKEKKGGVLVYCYDK